MKQFKMMRRLCTALLLAVLLAAQALAAVPEYLIPGGNTIGIKLYAKGLLVTQVGADSAAQAAGLREGDAILQVDGAPVSSARALSESIQNGRPVVLRLMRGGQEAEFLVSPQKTADGYRLGVSIRDHIAGIGTVTYYDPETGGFGALGHGVSGLVDAGLLPVSSGVVVSSTVAEVRRGSSGAPGALKGEFDLTHAAGSVTRNSPHGVFGVMESVPKKAAVPVGESSVVHTGSATILSNVSGDAVESFEIRIEKLYPEAENGRNMLLRVSDERLLDATGGIVQGMSGSPILQDGRLIGAVTHVLVNDPTRGYGIFIENMLDAA